MRVDFYHLTRDPVESAVALIARNTLKAGERLLVVADDEGRRRRIADALWALSPEAFVANGEAADPHAAEQPVLLSATPTPANGARFLALADGVWRDPADSVARTFFLFDEAMRGEARGTWKALRDKGGAELHYWKQEGGRWLEAG